MREPFVERMRHSGGIHDSIYARPQFVDGESIIFVARALLDLHLATADADLLDGAIRAGRLVAS